MRVCEKLYDSSIERRCLCDELADGELGLAPEASTSTTTTAGAVLTLSLLAVLTLLTVLSLLAVLTLLAVLSLLAVLTLLTVLSLLAILSLLTVLSLLAVVATVVTSVVVATVVAAIVTTATGECKFLSTRLAILGNLKANAVILSTTLGDGHNDRLMIAGGSHRADTVGTDRQTIGRRVGRQQTLAVTVVIDTLEEFESLGIQWLCLLEVLEFLNGDMRVSNNIPSVAKGLRSSVVGNIGIGERTSLEIGDLDRELDLLASLDSLQKLGRGDDTRNHLVSGRQVTHRDTVARTTSNLETVGDRLSCAEIDEVGGVSGRSCLSSFSLCQSIVVASRLDEFGPEGQGLVVSTVVLTVIVVVVLAVVILAIVVLTIVVLTVIVVVLAIVVVTTLPVLSELSLSNASGEHHRQYCCEPHTVNGTRARMNIMYTKE